MLSYLTIGEPVLLLEYDQHHDAIQHQDQIDNLPQLADLRTKLGTGYRVHLGKEWQSEPDYPGLRKGNKSFNCAGVPMEETPCPAYYAEFSCRLTMLPNFRTKASVLG